MLNTHPGVPGGGCAHLVQRLTLAGARLPEVSLSLAGAPHSGGGGSRAVASRKQEQVAGAPTTRNATIWLQHNTPSGTFCSVHTHGV